MLLLKMATVFLLALLARADKKIELLDIEEDNLKSEKDKEINKSDPFVSNLNPRDFFKYGFMQYIDGESKMPVQQQRYVQQYAVTEPPETAPAPAQQQYQPANTGLSQQAMIGYLSNIPMKVYIIPEFANNRIPAATNYMPTTAYAAPQNVYREFPLYMAPTAPQIEQTMPDYSQQVAYVTLSAQPTIHAVPAQINTVTAPGATANGQSFAYQIPRYYTQNAIEYQAAAPSKVELTESNRIEEPVRNEIDDEKGYYRAQTEPPFVKSPEHPRYYSSSSAINSAASLRDDDRYGQVAELPRPNPLLLHAPPSRYALLPKALPYHRPPNPVYSGISRPATFIPKRPTSLLDSYVPSGLQYEYLKRGYNKDHLSLYDALYNSRHHPQYPHPRKYERGFVPNQVFQTASGGVTFAHYKRAPKLEKSSPK